MQVMKRCVKIKGKLSTAWKQFSYLPHSLTAASENGARQCARGYYESKLFQGATQSHTPMEEERCPPCEYSLKRTSTNLVQSWRRTVLLGETCSQRTLLLSVHPLSERKHLVECCHALHVQRAHLQMLLWKAADKSDPPDVQLADYGLEVKEHETVMPAISREPAAP